MIPPHPSHRAGLTPHPFVLAPIPCEDLADSPSTCFPLPHWHGLQMEGRQCAPGSRTLEATLPPLGDLTKLQLASLLNINSFLHGLLERFNSFVFNLCLRCNKCSISGHCYYCLNVLSRCCFITQQNRPMLQTEAKRNYWPFFGEEERTFPYIKTYFCLSSDIMTF